MNAVANLTNLTEMIFFPQDGRLIADILYEALHLPDAWRHRRPFR
jgi:hypothetical protein